MVEHAWLIPLLPLLGFLVTVLMGRRAPGQGAGIGVAMIGLSLLLSLGVLAQVAGVAAPERFQIRSVSWLALGSTTVSLGFLVDPLSCVMLVVVTVVSLLVQIYSIGYMRGDPRFPLFYAYLGLFTAAMLGLVLAHNLVLLYAFWEVMGLASYLLIGFWFEKPSAMRAAKKAFMVTRLGDIGLFFGILGLIASTGTVEFSELVLGSPTVSAGHGSTIDAGPALSALKATAGGATLLGWIALLLFCGAIGKSAQFPLHVWLPDAMEGPTPVSALIHAATMVAAGVYLVARMYPVFQAAGPVPLPGAELHPLQLVAWIGVGTAIMASVIALTQPDIKRVLAYSTISQLGYMVFGLGVGAFTAATFHLVTHAFFKALLFLGSGSVIHSTGTQDIWEMGGLRGKMRITFLTFAVGYLALSGIPPFSGFWSKDAILDHAFHSHPGIWVAGLAGVFLTAFYMTRLMQVVFFGKWRGGAANEAHRPSASDAHHLAREPDASEADSSSNAHHLSHEPHESPRVMTGPLVLLAVLAAAVGLVGTPFANIYGRFIFTGAYPHSDHLSSQMLGLMGISTGVALAGIALGALLYQGGQFRFAGRSTNALMIAVYRLSYNKLYFDELYWRALVVPFLMLTRLAATVDSRLIDGIVNGVGRTTLLLSHLYRLFDVYVIDLIVNLVGWIPKQAGRALRYVQTGQVQAYLLGLCCGALLLFWLFLQMS